MRMPTSRRGAGWFGALVMLAMLVLLGVLSLGGCSSVPSHSTPGGPTIRATPQPNGCPTQQAPTSWPAPDVVVTGPGIPSVEPTLVPGEGRLVNVPRGQRVDFRLASGFKWDVSQAPASGILQPIAPAGWYDAVLEVCVWGYTAAAAGTTEVDFVGSPICAPGQACPAYAILARYQVVVR